MREVCVKVAASRRTGKRRRPRQEPLGKRGPRFRLLVHLPLLETSLTLLAANLDKCKS